MYKRQVYNNTAPDQTVVLTGSGATTVTGTYPNFTIDSTNSTYTAGTNIAIDGAGQISSTDTTYTAGTNVTITGNVISTYRTSMVELG